MKKAILIPFFLLMILDCHSQDIVFSHLNHSKLSINPGFAGSNKLSDIIVGHRNFSPTGFGNYMTYRASFNSYVDWINGGVGLQVMRDDQGQGAISRTYISGIYAYRVQLRKNTFLQPAIETRFASYSLNTSDLVFPDMFDRASWQISGDRETITRRSDHYLDFSAGVILHHENEYLRTYRDYTLGIAVQHLNRPTALLNDQTRISRRLMVYFDIEIFLKYLDTYQSSTLLIPTFTYSVDQSSDMFHYGTYLKYKNLRMGAFIRHNSGLNYITPIFQLGANYREFSLDYSYDAGFLNYKRTSVFSGAHEVTLSINLSIKGSS